MRHAIMVCLLMFVVSHAALGSTFYVDCGSGSDTASGTSQQDAWKTLKKVSDTTFSPGDSILLRRDTHCPGSLSPKGSGDGDRPIRIGAYGAGPLPLIEAGPAPAAIYLMDQQGWEIENIETTGGEHFGIYVGATSKKKLSHYLLRNLVVHDVTGTVKEKRSGLVVVSGENGAVLEDVVVDGVTAYKPRNGPAFTSAGRVAPSFAIPLCMTFTATGS